MRYKIKDIPAEGLLVQAEIGKDLLADALQGMEATLEASRGDVRLELSKDSDDNVYVRGALKALVTVPCARCLAAALVKIDTRLAMTLVPEEDADDASDEDPLDDVDVASYEGGVVDLDGIVREQIILGVPMSPRCRAECAGLCATCGQNKNERDCGHAAPGPADTRFAALKDVKLT